MGKGEEEISVGGSGSQKNPSSSLPFPISPPSSSPCKKNPSESPLRIHRYGKTQFSSSPSTTKGGGGGGDDGGDESRNWDGEEEEEREEDTQSRYIFPPPRRPKVGKLKGGG